MTFNDPEFHARWRKRLPACFSQAVTNPQLAAGPAAFRV